HGRIQKYCFHSRGWILVQPKAAHPAKAQLEKAPGMFLDPSLRLLLSLFVVRHFSHFSNFCSLCRVLKRVVLVIHAGEEANSLIGEARSLLETRNSSPRLLRVRIGEPSAYELRMAQGASNAATM